ncbi:MAG: WYL domain-containing protein [Firmicutes bacterium]|nr:WYL domain-containing protein [Bacillota bacterium]
MKLNYPSLVRLSQMDYWIRKDFYPDVGFFAERFETSNRTVFRDLRFIKDSMGAPLCFDRKKNGYFYKEKTWNFPMIPFSEKELLALQMVKLAIGKNSDFPFEEHFESAFEKIAGVIPDDVRQTFAELESKLSFRFSGCRFYNFHILDTIIKSLKLQNSVKIRYFTASSGVVSDRIVDPYHLDNFRGDWYLIGFCHKRLEVRVFSVNRIKECSLLNKTFHKSAGFDYQEFIKSAFGVIRTDSHFDVVIRFTGYDARAVRECTWHSSQIVEEHNDGSTIVRFCVSGIEELIRWIMIRGKNAEVLEPQWLRAKVKEELIQTLNLYQSD